MFILFVVYADVGSSAKKSDKISKAEQKKKIVALSFSFISCAINVFMHLEESTPRPQKAAQMHIKVYEITLFGNILVFLDMPIAT